MVIEATLEVESVGILPWQHQKPCTHWRVFQDYSKWSSKLLVSVNKPSLTHCSPWLILVPDVIQVAENFQSLLDDLVVLCIYGGTPYEQQERPLREGVDVVVGTPGRIQDLVNKGKLDLGRVKHAVLDEVDQMLDMGFRDKVSVPTILCIQRWWTSKVIGRLSLTLAEQTALVFRKFCEIKKSVC